MRSALARLRRRAIGELGAAVAEMLDSIHAELAALRADHEARLATLEARSAMPGFVFSLDGRLPRLDEHRDDDLRRFTGMLAGSGTVLELGCGRGELLAGLDGTKVAAFGVDADPENVRVCQAAGLQVVLEDPVEGLAATAPGSLGALVARNVVDCLELQDLARLVALASTRLGPGGLLILAATNPTSLAGLGGFWADPRHRRPVHPDLLRAIVEHHGFGGVHAESAETSEQLSGARSYVLSGRRTA